MLQRALQRNTIACVNNDFSRIFMGLTVVREMSQSVRIPFHDGGKRTIYLADSGVTFHVCTFKKYKF